MYVLTPRLVALITHRIMLSRRVWAYSRRLSAHTVPGRCPGGARKTSGGCPGAVREGSGRCPRRYRRSVTEGLDWTLLAFGGRRRGQRKNNGNSARGCLTFSVKTVKLPRVFDIFADERFSLTGAMVLHSFAKPPRLCTKCETTAPVHKNERLNEQNGSGTRVLT